MLLTHNNTITDCGSFKWRGRDGQYVKLRNVHTKRLFYIAKMIWNHSAPPHQRIWDDHRYTFDKEIYTEAYMTEAFKHCVMELSLRDDLGPKMRGVLVKMAEYSKILKDLGDAGRRGAEAGNKLKRSINRLRLEADK